MNFLIFYEVNIIFRKADIRNPLSLLAHERSRFATCVQKKMCALCHQNSHLFISFYIFLYLMNYLIHRYHCFFPHGAFFLFL